MNLSDLHNPKRVIEILVWLRNKKPHTVFASTDQGFQERPGSWELWQLIDGRLYRVQRWLKKTIGAVYTNE